MEEGEWEGGEGREPRTDGRALTHTQTRLDAPVVGHGVGKHCREALPAVLKVVERGGGDRGREAL